jgi:hypothetical protein
VATGTSPSAAPLELLTLVGSALDGLNAGALVAGDERECRERDLGFPHRAPNRLAEKAGPFWSARHVIEALNLSGNDELMCAVEHRQLLSVMTSDGVLLFPSWQFDIADGTAKVRPLLLPVFAILGGHDCWAVCVVLRNPDSTDLGGRSALEVADEGDPHHVLERYARHIDQEWRAGSEGRRGK